MPLTAEKIDALRESVYKQGRLLERQLFEYFFGTGTQLTCVNTLLAYQNPNGGFGNGLEPDLLCPESSAIAAETALHTMGLLDFYDPAIIEMLLRWIMAQQDERGVIPHPSGKMMDYPHQPWWENPDDHRILSLAGFLKMMGVSHMPFFIKVREYFEQLQLPSADDFYAYPYFIYLKYCGETGGDREKLENMIDQMPERLEKHADHFPLFTRGWHHAAEFLSSETVEAEAEKFLNAIGEDGLVETPYPDLPWWKVPWTLDGLILLKKRNLA